MQPSNQTLQKFNIPISIDISIKTHQLMLELMLEVGREEWLEVDGTEHSKAHRYLSRRIHYRVRYLTFIEAQRKSSVDEHLQHRPNTRPFYVSSVQYQGCNHRGDWCNRGLTQIFRYLNSIAPNQGEQSLPTIKEVAANIFSVVTPLPLFRTYYRYS